MTCAAQELLAHVNASPLFTCAYLSPAGETGQIQGGASWDSNVLQIDLGASLLVLDSGLRISKGAGATTLLDERRGQSRGGKNASEKGRKVHDEVLFFVNMQR